MSKLSFLIYKYNFYLHHDALNGMGKTYQQYMYVQFTYNASVTSSLAMHLGICIYIYI